MIEISKNVQKTLKKVSKVGVLHKYIDENTYITLQPRSPNTLPQNQGQVLLTHKKRVFSDNINEEKFVSVYLPRFTKMLKEFCE